MSLNKLPCVSEHEVPMCEQGKPSPCEFIARTTRDAMGQVFSVLWLLIGGTFSLARVAMIWSKLFTLTSCLSSWSLFLPGSLTRSFFCLPHWSGMPLDREPFHWFCLLLDPQSLDTAALRT